MWLSTFCKHTLSFSHWYKIYQHEKAQQIELAKKIHVYPKEQDDDNDQNDIPMAAQQPYPSTPTHRLAKIISFGVKQLDFVNHVALTNKELQQLIKQSQGFTNKLVEQTPFQIMR